MGFYFCWEPWVDSKKKEVIDLDNGEDFVEELEVKKKCIVSVMLKVLSEVEIIKRRRC